MKIQSCKNYEQMSAMAANIVLAELVKKKNLLLCAPTGNSPTGMYQSLAQTYLQSPEIFNALRVLKLDEWGGLSADHPGSCDYYLQKYVLDPLHIPHNRYDGFKPNPEDAEKECERVRQIIDHEASIDVCILGLGKNGHIGFNEPAEFLRAHCHVAKLSEESKKHGMVKGMEQKPEYGMTLGMKDILSAKRIVLLIYGKGKEDATSMLMSKRITSQFPVTFLWLHANVDCLVVQD